MEDQIKSLIHAHDKLQTLHIMGSEAITYANAMVELTQAINELQKAQQESEIKKEE